MGVPNIIVWFFAGAAGAAGAPNTMVAFDEGASAWGWLAAAAFEADVPNIIVVLADAGTCGATGGAPLPKTIVCFDEGGGALCCGACC